jgi:hypothetical protein
MLPLAQVQKRILKLQSAACTPSCGRVAYRGSHASVGHTRGLHASLFRQLVPFQSSQPRLSLLLRRDVNHHARNRLAIAFRAQELICIAFEDFSPPEFREFSCLFVWPCSLYEVNAAMPDGGSAMFHPPDFALGLSPLQQYAKHHPSQSFDWMRFAFTRVLLLMLVHASLALSAFAICMTPKNAIEAENCLPGDPPSQWYVDGAGSPSIQGFATDISVNAGQTIFFKICLRQRCNPEDPGRLRQALLPAFKSMTPPHELATSTP